MKVKVDLMSYALREGARKIQNGLDFIAKTTAGENVTRCITDVNIEDEFEKSLEVLFGKPDWARRQGKEEKKLLPEVEKALEK